MRFHKYLDYLINIPVAQSCKNYSQSLFLLLLLDNWMYSGIFVPTLKNFPQNILSLRPS